MKKLFVAILLLLQLASLRAQPQKPAARWLVFFPSKASPAQNLTTLRHITVCSVSINNRRGALMIDTGSPNTAIDVNSVNTFGLTVVKTGSSVGGLFGRSWERYGASKIKSIAMGNCTLTNVPVAIADFSTFNQDRSGPATDRTLQIRKPCAHHGCLVQTK